MEPTRTRFQACDAVTKRFHPKQALAPLPEDQRKKRDGNLGNDAEQAQSGAGESKTTPSDVKAAGENGEGARDSTGDVSAGESGKNHDAEQGAADKSA